MNSTEPSPTVTRKIPHNKLTAEEFIERSLKIHNGKYSYGKTNYVNSNTRVTITCPKHGDFEQLAYVHLGGSGCRDCRSEKISLLRRKTNEQFIAEARAKHGDYFNYDKTVYGPTGADKIIVTCPKHGDFETTGYSHLKSDHGCLACAAEYTAEIRTRTSEEFIADAKAIHGDRYDYSKTVYTSRFDDITVICKAHGEFQQSPMSHLIGSGCRQCSIEASSQRYRSNTQEFIDKAKAVHGDTYDYSKAVYGKNGGEKVTIICKTHGEFQQTPHDHLAGKGCRKCYTDTVGHHRRLSNEDFIEKIRAIHGDKYGYEKVNYVNTRSKVTLVCPKHGDFHTKANSIIANHQGCPRCNYSKGENTIKRILRKHSIEFIDQYKIPDCRSRFRYDFYLPRLNLFIEFQGEQHFRPMGFMGGEDALKDVQTRDRLKKDLALDMKYRIVYFDYKQFRLPPDEFESLVMTTLNHYKPFQR